MSITRDARALSGNQSDGTSLGLVYTGPDKFGTGPRLGPDRPCVHTGPPGTGTI